MWHLLNIATHFCMALQLMMMHHHTKFGYKRLSSSHDIFWTKAEHTEKQMDMVLPPLLGQGGGGI